MMSYDDKSQTVIPFGHNQSVARQQFGQKNPSCHLYFVVIDILYMNDSSIIELELNKRRTLLKRIVGEKLNYFELVKYSAVKPTTENMMDALDKACLDRKHEGIIIKDVTSAYELGNRSMKWIKLKRDQIAELSVEMDVLILGAYYSESTRRRKKGIKFSTFVCGLRDTKHDFVVLKPVSSGLSDSQLSQLQSELEPYLKKCTKQNVPSYFWCCKNLPDFIIDPSKSVILQIRFTLLKGQPRFPIIERVRYDKNKADVFDPRYFALQESFATKESIKIKRKASDLIKSSSTIIKTPKRQRSHQLSFLAKDLPPEDIDTIVVNKSLCLFKNLEFCVCDNDNVIGKHSTNNSDGFSKHDLERKIVEHGGSITQNPRDFKTTAIICKEIEVGGSQLLVGRSQVYAKSKKWDVLKYDYIIDCIKAKELLPYYSKYILNLTSKSIEMNKKSFDSYGDHYTFPATKETLLDSLNKVNDINVDDAADVDELWSTLSDAEQKALTIVEYNIFRNVDAFIPSHLYTDDLLVKSPKPNDNVFSHLTITKSLLELHGAKISDYLHSQVTHIIQPTFNAADIANYRIPSYKLQLAFKSLHINDDQCNIVNENWVLDSVRQVKSLPTQLYQLN